MTLYSCGALVPCTRAQSRDDDASAAANATEQRAAKAGRCIALRGRALEALRALAYSTRAALWCGRGHSYALHAVVAAASGARIDVSRWRVVHGGAGAVKGASCLTLSEVAEAPGWIHELRRACYDPRGHVMLQGRCTRHGPAKEKEGFEAVRRFSAASAPALANGGGGGATAPDAAPDAVVMLSKDRDAVIVCFGESACAKEVARFPSRAAPVGALSVHTDGPHIVMCARFAM